MTKSNFALTQALPEYQQLRKAIAQRKLPLVIVCGAGLSAPARLPNWNGLRKILERNASAKVASLNQMGQKLYDSKLKTASSTNDLWIAFDLYHDILTPPVFRNLIVEALTPDPNLAVPDGYTALLKLQPRGLVTLNLDKFASEAFASIQLGKVITPVYGFELATKWHVLRDAPQYVVYLHGELTDSTNWVLTKSQLDKLLVSGAHTQFLSRLYADHIVIFAGVSADDIALSSKLLNRRPVVFKPPALYWLTTRLDQATLQWASDNYISVINYQAGTNEEHSSFFVDLASDFLAFLPTEEPTLPPIINSRLQYPPPNVPSDARALAQLTPEEIRIALSHNLQELIVNTPPNKLYEEFQSFCKRYKYPISRAFFKDDDPDFSTWFGFKLTFPALGGGNFGEVFLSNDRDSNQIALKIMHYNILDDTNMLGGFRRGIRSMRFLNEAKIKGVTKLIDSYELPPTIVMEYISGVTLQDGLEARPKLPWTIKLHTILKVAEIVHSSHSLAMTVMHRDLKPSNIMIRNFDYQGWFDPDVVVLDFDMSWHKGSSEKDVIFESRDDFGYLSPEQTANTRGVSTVSTRVDSYGLGMTAYYIFGGMHPRPNEGLSDNWYQTALRATKKDYAERWKSAPFRLARIIRDSTMIVQADRMDFAIAFKELQTLFAAVTAPELVSNPEFWAEEILANLPSPSEYDWNIEGPFGEIRLERGMIVKCQPDFRNSRVDLTIEFQFKGAQNYSRLTQKIESVPAKLKKLIEDAGWHWDRYNRGSYQAQLGISIDVESIKLNAGTALSAASEAFKLFEAIVSS